MLLLKYFSDDPDFHGLLDNFFERVASRLRPSNLFLTRIDNWFDWKWLGFASTVPLDTISLLGPIILPTATKGVRRAGTEWLSHRSNIPIRPWSRAPRGRSAARKIDCRPRRRTVMLASPRPWNPRSVPFVLVAMALVIPMPVSAGDGDVAKPRFEGFVAYDQLAREDSGLEDRIARYTEALAEMTSMNGTDTPRRRDLPGFFEVAADLGASWKPEDAVAAALYLTGTTGSRELYEELGVALLGAARLDRFAQQDDRALSRLRAARHAFDLADREKRKEGSATGERDFIHRAMVRLEEILVTDSEDPWNDAADLLAKQLEVTPTGPTADWAQRILGDPSTYVGEQDPDAAEGPIYVGDDVRPPVKIFAPPPRYTDLARKSRIQGVVIVQVVIDRHGTVAALKLLKGLPLGLGEEALRNMSTWLFEPATLDGRPVMVYYNLTLNFRL